MTKKLIFIMLVFLSFKNIVFAGWPVAVSTGSAKDNFNSARNTFVVEHNTTDGIHENVRVRNSFQVGGVSTSTYNFYVSSSSIILPTTNISGAGSGSTLDADTIDLHDSIYFQTALTTTSWVAYDSYRWRGMDSTATWKVYDSGKWDGIDSTDTFLSTTMDDLTLFQIGAATFTATGNVAGATYGSDASVTDAELLYVDATSSIQTQINAKYVSLFYGYGNSMVYNSSDTTKAWGNWWEGYGKNQEVYGVDFVNVSTQTCEGLTITGKLESGVLTEYWLQSPDTSFEDLDVWIWNYAVLFDSITLTGNTTWYHRTIP